MAGYAKVRTVPHCDRPWLDQAAFLGSRTLPCIDCIRARTMAAFLQQPLHPGGDWPERDRPPRIKIIVIVMIMIIQIMTITIIILIMIIIILIMC